jgi:trimeric autotransporter adhesin
MLHKFPPPPKYNKIYGTDNDETLQGTAATDLIYAGDGKDVLIGGGGTDYYFGGKGDDEYHVQDAGDVVVEHADEGYDTVRSYVDDYTLGDNVEKLILVGDTVTGTGNELNNKLVGNDKTNVLFGLDGNDSLDGGKGIDIMQGGDGDDQYWVDNVSDIAWEQQDNGSDLVHSTVSYKLGMYVENLFLDDGAGAINGTGNESDNHIRGNESDNTIKGEGGHDHIVGFGGKDKMYGGTGDDYIVVDSSDDTVIEYAGEGYDTVFAKASYVNPLNVEHMIMDGLGTMVGLGNSQDNSILGNTGDTIMFGGGGKDTLHGFYGNDTINGGAGDDRIIGGYDTDTLTGGGDNDTFWFAKGFGNDTVTDFKANGDLDVIEFEAGIFSDFADMLWSTKQVGDDTVIKLDAAGSSVVTLQGVDMSTLQAQDFQFA